VERDADGPRRASSRVTAISGVGGCRSIHGTGWCRPQLDLTAVEGHELGHDGVGHRMQAGRWSKRDMTMAAFLADQPIALPYSNCWQISERIRDKVAASKADLGRRHL